jgi:NitT/TauT family transport system ATP-binding protein
MNTVADAAVAAVTIDDVYFRYGPPYPVIAGMTLEIAAEQVTCLVGPSGCGKSTLLNLIAGLLQPDRGSVRRDAGVHGRTGYLFQQDALLPWRTVYGNLRLPSELRGIPSAVDTCRICNHLLAFHLDDAILNRYPDELSGGMRQRVALIQALMADPALLLLDEPFAALDVYTRLQLETEFRTMVAAQRMSAVFVTHDIEQAIAIGDRVLVMGSNLRGIVADIAITFGRGERPSPARIRGELSFGEYYTSIWRCLRDAI